MVISLLILLFIALVMIGLSQNAFARDDRLMFPINAALSASAAQEKLQGIDFYFGNQKHPKVLKDFGEFSTNKKSSDGSDDIENEPDSDTDQSTEDTQNKNKEKYLLIKQKLL